MTRTDSDHSMPIGLADSRVSDHGASVAAGKIGCTVEAYRTHEANGEAWCTGCQDWHSRDAFRPNACRASGVSNYCREQQAQLDAARYQQIRVRNMLIIGRKNGVSYAGPAFSLTPEGAAAVSRAGSAWSEPAASCAQPVTVPSGHLHCPAVLGCREGRLPEGWVRERQEVAS